MRWNASQETYKLAKWEAILKLKAKEVLKSVRISFAAVELA